MEDQKRQDRSEEKPTDKYARSDQAPPTGQPTAPDFISDVDTEDVVVDASEDSFPASDPPASTIGRAARDKHPADAHDDPGSS